MTPVSASRSLLQCPEASPAAAKVSWLLRCKDLRIYLPWLLLAMPRTSGRQRQHKKVPSKYHCQCVDSESHCEFQGGLCYLLTHVSSDNSLEPLVPSLMGQGKRAWSHGSIHTALRTPRYDTALMNQTPFKCLEEAQFRICAWRSKLMKEGTVCSSRSWWAHFILLPSSFFPTEHTEVHILLM